MALAPRPRAEVVPGEWTYHAERTVGGEPLGPIHPHGFSCTRKLNGFGTGQLTLPAEPGALDQELLLRLWSWKVWCIYAGEPAFCGVATGVEDAGDLITVTLTEITNYLSKRAYDPAGGHHYVQAEQCQIAADLAQPLADVGVQVVTTPGPGFPRDRQYEYLEGASRAELLANLSQVISGPEFRSEYSWALDGRPRCVLHVGYPRVGGASGVGITVPGNATEYRVAWDSDALRTRTFAVGEVAEGAPEGTPKPVALEDRPQAGLPRLDAVDDWASTYLLTTLRERAATAAAQSAAAALEITATTTVAEPGVTGYNVGDDATLSITTPLLPGGIEATARLTEVTVSAGDGTAAWTVALALPPPRPREQLTARLDRLDTTLAAFRRRRLQPQ